MNYKARRNNKRISFYTMCKRLGLDKQTYLEVEKGKKNLEGEYIDKFEDTIANAEGIKLERTMRIAKINEWIKSGECLERLKEMGYTQASLARTLKMHPASICKTFKGDPMISDDTKEEIYDFLNNNLNKNVGEPIRAYTRKQPINQETTKPIDVVKEVEEVVNKEVPTEASSRSFDVRDEYIRKLERQIMIYEKLIMKL
jgi:transcriptional regulator with XRE-family HTH domain